MEDEDDDSDGEGLVIQEDEDVADADAGKGDGATDGSGDGGGVSPDSRLIPKAGEKEESPKAEEKALEEMPVPSGKSDKNKAITDEILKD